MKEKPVKGGSEMFSRRMVALVGMVALALMVAQPAQAGVGGCNTRFGVGGCTHISANPPEQAKTPSALDALRGAIPADVIAMLQAIFGTSDGGVVQPSDTTDQGVGGCRQIFGVGGCVLCSGAWAKNTAQLSARGQAEETGRT